MFPIEAVVMILAMLVLTGAGLATTHLVLKHRREMAKIKHGDKTAPKLDHEKAQLKETVAMLQDRMAVLESIATDPARRTAEEIEKLR